VSGEIAHSAAELFELLWEEFLVRLPLQPPGGDQGEKQGAPTARRWWSGRK
jgi:hypothetical protein